MHPLTIDTPKPLLKVRNKALLEQILEALPDDISEVFIVFGYLASQILDYFGSDWNGRKINYVLQEKKLGTAHALKLCEPFIEKGERFLMLYADDLHGKESLENCFRQELGIVVSKVRDPRPFGVVSLNEDGSIREIIEKPENPSSHLVSTGAMVLDKRIFDYKADIHPNGEYYLTDSVNKMLSDHKIFAVQASFWLPIGYPDDLEKAEKLLAKKELEMFTLNQIQAEKYAF